MNELTKRILIAIFGIPTITILIFLGGWYFFLLIFIIGTVAQWEFYTMHKKKDIHPQIINGLTGGVLILLGMQSGQWQIIGGILLLLILAMLGYEMFAHRINAGLNIGVTLLGIIYIPLLLGLLIITRSSLDLGLAQTADAGFKFIMILLLTIWICDTFAYAFGRSFGKHKLYEKVSPNKTVEGALAGLLGAILTIFVVKSLSIFPLNWSEAVLIGLVIGVLGQMGDLVESWFKRDVGVKDSSSLLPGHGGMLDRFDSLIFLSPAVYILVSILF